jgi:hypothetical protein
MRSPAPPSFASRLLAACENVIGGARWPLALATCEAATASQSIAAIASRAPASRAAVISSVARATRLTSLAHARRADRPMRPFGASRAPTRIGDATGVSSLFASGKSGRRPEWVPVAGRTGGDVRDGGDGEREAARRETVARPITCARRGFALSVFKMAGLPIRSLRFGRARSLGKREARATRIARASFFQAAFVPFGLGWTAVPSGSSPVGRAARSFRT